MGRPARRQLEIEHVRKEILHAAGRAFSRQGFDSVTIHDIAKEAGYTAPSLYAYFKGKQEIIDALLAAVRDEFKGAFDAEISPGLSFRERLASLFERFSEIAGRWPEALVLVLEFKRSASARSKRQQRQAARQSMDATLVEWLKRNSASTKDLAGRQPEDIAFIIRSLILGAFLPVDHGTSNPHNRFALALHVCLGGLSGRSPHQR
jgi:AcrR family transcriptional regulator